MPHPKILVIPGSIRNRSHNARLAALAVKELTLADADVTQISLYDYTLPLYDPDHDMVSGPPHNAIKLKQMMAAHHGIFITSPEYNASLSPLVKNVIDWVSRVRERGEPAYTVFRGRPFALGAASPDPLGGARGLMALRQTLELGCGALVLPEQVIVPDAENAFDDLDNLKDARQATSLRTLARRLVEAAQQFS
jgi:chromate reductase, NAD(P)H dehydrogenase (quinone)